MDGSTAPDGTVAGDASFDASACQPGDISDFKFTWKAPTAFHQGACASNGEETPLWEQFYAACLDPQKRDQKICQEFTDASGAYYKCGQCLATMDTADHYGPLIIHSGWVELNISGCLANAMNDPSGVKCASSVQAVRACEFAACNANCPVTSDATLALFDNCTQSADDTLCKMYVDATGCVDKIPDAGGIPAKCLPSKDGFEKDFYTYAELFCGGSAPMDAGGGGD